MYSSSSSSSSSPNSYPLPLLLSLLVISPLFIIISSSSSSPLLSLSTVAVSRISNNTLVCALIPSTPGSKQFDLNCTSFPNGTTHRYPSSSSSSSSYSAVAAGDGFLCALSSPFSSNTSAMTWWDFAHNPNKSSIPDPKRLYFGPSILGLSAGDSHVCALTTGGGSPQVDCWRWPELGLPLGLNLSSIAVGGDFVCGVSDVHRIKCFGGGGGGGGGGTGDNNNNGVVGHEPEGNFSLVAAGSSHACGVSIYGELSCWGIGAPEIGQNMAPTPTVSYLALGNKTTCVIDLYGIVHCWGLSYYLSPDFANQPFVGIQARGNAFCGVLMANYALLCWGTQEFHENHLVYKLVLPGACSFSCPCGPLSGTAYFCDNGASICRTCLPLAVPRGARVRSDAKRRRRRRRPVRLIVIGSIGFVTGLIAIAFFLFLKLKHRKGRIHSASRHSRGSIQAFEQIINGRLEQLFIKTHNPTMEEFPMKVLVSITDGFSEKRKIGSGSFGSVYRAKLVDGRIVAIKRMESPASTSASSSRARSPHGGDNWRQDKESAFCSELGLLSRVNHKNLVRLLGFCKEGLERILVYEFMANGTLMDLLHKSDHQLGSPLGSWAARIRVALDAARGIEYLHTYAVPPIIHRDIKSSNILLDEEWTAKVSDFGLSLLSPDAADINRANLESLRTAGTVGYIDPEYYRLQHLTAKSDVYSFGVVLLEILSGCRVIQKYGESVTPRNVVEFAVPHIVVDDVHRVLDARLGPPTPSEIEAVAYVGYLAADCVSPEGRERPTMTEIVNGLERALAAISDPSSTGLPMDDTGIVPSLSQAAVVDGGGHTETC